jgi:hypothetical protein
MLQALIQTAACAVLLQQHRHKGFYRKQAQTLHKLEGFRRLGFAHCATLPLAGLIRLHEVMHHQASFSLPDLNVVVQSWKQDVVLR